MLDRQISLKHELFGAWCAPIFSVLTVVGWLGLAHFWHPASGGFSAEELRQWYDERQLPVILGMSIFCAATAFLTIYSVQLGLWLWRFEGSPLLTLTSMLGGFAVVIYVFISNCLWIGVAYRSDIAKDAEIMRAINDAAWFSFLVGWVGLTQQMLATGFLTIRDKRATPLVPRWLSWFSIIGALFVPMANGCAFAKTGIFSWDGVLGFYVPISIWAFWVDAHAFFIRRDVKRRMADAEAGTLVEDVPAASVGGLAGVANL